MGASMNDPIDSATSIARAAADAAKRGAEKNDEAAKLIGQRDAYDMLTRRVRGS
jgi:hypothetical protein